MQTPLFLTVDEISEIHQEMIELFGGSHGIRDRALLESAAHAPQSGFGGEYLHKDLFEMDAADLVHLVQNHAFVDGNKRVGASAASTFLKMNGYALLAEEPDFADMVLKMAKSEVGKPEVTEFLRENSKQMDAE